MLYAVKGSNETLKSELELAFQFRHNAFVEEAGWENLRRADAREMDQFDTLDTIHIILIKNGRV